MDSAEFRSSVRPGLRSRFGTAKSGQFGRNVSRFEIVSYLSNNREAARSTCSSTGEWSAPSTPRPWRSARGSPSSAFPDGGPHEFELLTRRANVRLFEKPCSNADEPGVVLDAVGVVGARLRTLDESDDAHFAEALAWRKPNLVVFQFGRQRERGRLRLSDARTTTGRWRTTSSGRCSAPHRTRDALVIGAMDRARKENDHLVTVPIIPLIVEEQRKVAAGNRLRVLECIRRNGRAGNSMAKWVRKRLPGAGDYTHPTRLGRRPTRQVDLQRADDGNTQSGRSSEAEGASSPVPVPETSHRERDGSNPHQQNSAAGLDLRKIGHGHAYGPGSSRGEFRDRLSRDAVRPRTPIASWRFRAPRSRGA